MKISWNWLSEWVDTEGLDPEVVAERLTLAGLECEGIDYVGRGHDKIVVARIESIEEHPKADRLVVCQVNTGGETLHQIVCGATNMKAGDLVPAALPGSQPPAFDFEIGRRKMRGVESQGMLCAAEELGLEDDVDGLMILSPELEPGTPIFEALSLVDTIIELGVTPNRPDCLSHFGVAREVAALFERSLGGRGEAERAPLWEGEANQALAECELVVDALDGCPRYAFAILEDVSVGKSPDWLVSKLASIGVRSINNVVDVTNYILFDIGQPLHAFDLDRLGQDRAHTKILVRHAEQGESMVGINHKTYTLSAQDLVITDGEQPVAIAGVMGGEGTEVTELTRRVLLECAYFDPTTVRKSSKRHDLHTDSSHRFERGIDPGATLINLQRAVDVMAHVCKGARVLQGCGLVQLAEVEALRIELPVAMPGRVLGMTLSARVIMDTLASIGLSTLSHEAGVLTVEVPTWRPDIERAIDLVEEVGRLIGYDNIQERLPRGDMGNQHRRRKDATLADTILTQEHRKSLSAARRTLLEQGLHEVVNYSFFGSAELDELGIPEAHAMRCARAVANPLTVEHGLMRTSLLPGLVRNLRTNLAQRRLDVALFEVGRRYLVDGEREPTTLGLLLTGQRQQHWSGGSAWDFYDLKGIAESVVTGRELSAARWQVPATPEPYLHPGVQAEWVLDGQRLAIIGRLHPGVEQALDLPLTLLGELDLERALGLQPRELSYQKMSPYPAITRDFALLQASGEPYASIESELHAFARLDEKFGEVLKSVQVFDVYEGEHIEAGKRSIAVQLVLRAPDRTLTDEEVQHISTGLISHLEAHAGVSLRS